MQGRVRTAATAAAVVFYVLTVGLAVALLVVVGDHTLAVALVALEVSVVTSAHLVLRRSRALATTAPPDPSLPVLDRPGPEPATRQGAWGVIGAMLGVIAAIAVLVIILNALAH